MKKADSAVPTMPAPNTPVAKPLRAGGYQAELNGIPTANTVPAIPSRNEKTSIRGKDFIEPARPTRSTSGVLTASTRLIMMRPPYLSVRPPIGIRPTAPIKIGMATSKLVVPGFRFICSGLA